MENERLMRTFQREQAKRAVEQAQDLEELKSLTLSLLAYSHAQQDMLEKLAADAWGIKPNG